MYQNCNVNKLSKLLKIGLIQSSFTCNAKPIVGKLQHRNFTQLQRWRYLKKMGKKYWYVVLPVHIIVSSLTFAFAYCLSVNGIDIGYQMTKLPLITEEYVNRVQSSNMGNIAISLLFFKVATPFRFVTTLTVSTILIKYLRRTGLIK